MHVRRLNFEMEHCAVKLAVDLHAALLRQLAQLREGFPGHDKELLDPDS